MKNIDLRK